MSYTGDRSLTCVRLNRLRADHAPEGYLPGLYCEDAYYIKGMTAVDEIPEFGRAESRYRARHLGNRMRRRNRQKQLCS